MRIRISDLKPSDMTIAYKTSSGVSTFKTFATYQELAQWKANNLIGEDVLLEYPNGNIEVYKRKDK